MAAAKIRANHDELKQMSQTFSAQSDAIKQMSDNLRSNMDTLEGGDWIGKGAKAFYSEMGGAILPALRNLNHALVEGAKITNAISNVMRKAEKEAHDALKNWSYDA